MGGECFKFGKHLTSTSALGQPDLLGFTIFNPELPEKSKVIIEHPISVRILVQLPSSDQFFPHVKRV